MLSGHRGGYHLSRQPVSDDGWFASPPYNLIHHGHFGTTTIDPHGYLLHPELTHINQRTYWALPADLLAQAAWYSVVGVGLVQMRLLTLLFKHHRQSPSLSTTGWFG